MVVSKKTQKDFEKRSKNEKLDFSEVQKFCTGVFQITFFSIEQNVSYLAKYFSRQVKISKNSQKSNLYF